MLNSQFRGLLVDTARHYLHPDTIKSAIDVLAYNKVTDSRRPLFLFPCLFCCVLMTFPFSFNRYIVQRAPLACDRRPVVPHRIQALPQAHPVRTYIIAHAPPHTHHRTRTHARTHARARSRVRRLCLIVPLMQGRIQQARCLQPRSGARHRQLRIQPRRSRPARHPPTSHNEVFARVACCVSMPLINVCRHILHSRVRHSRPRCRVRSNSPLFLSFIIIVIVELIFKLFITLFVKEFILSFIINM